MTLQIFDFEQGSPEWAAARLGIPTASEFSSILAKGQGKTRRTYLLKLAGERLTGEPMSNFTNANMERGKIMEEEARNFYSFIQDVDVARVGFIRNGRKGCSPDSLVGANGMLEIKTNVPHIQLEAVFADRMPPEHQPQVQGLLWIAEREWCDFTSYWPKLPFFVKRVYRNEPYIKELAAEVDRFSDELDELVARLGNYSAAPGIPSPDPAAAPIDLSKAPLPF